ncbi:MAG TPA: hypothetical protein VGK67_39950 [Myxococcales bacterium]|jgi:hypothetical protein
MTTVNEKSFANPMIGLEDGMSVPAETKCTNAAKPAEPAAANSGDVDTFETLQLKSRLNENSAARAKLRPELQEKRTEALRELPKAIPMMGTISKVGFAIWDAAHGTVGKSAVDAGKSMAETKAFNELGRVAVDKYGEAAGEGVEALAVFKEAYDIYGAMREYGKLVKEDEALRYEAEDLMMKLDPTRKFELVKVNGKAFFRQDGELISDQPAEKATKADYERLADIRSRLPKR